MKSLPHPTPEEVERVLDGMRDGSNVYVKWIKSGFDENLMRSLWWVVPYTASDNCEHDVWACGYTLEEACAVAWIEAYLQNGWWFDDDHMSQEDYVRVPRRVPEDWRFELYDAPADFGGTGRLQ